MNVLYKHEYFRQLLDITDPNSVFVEIGSARGEGSTQYLGDLAKEHNVKFLTVDIDDKINFDKLIKEWWSIFYQDIRDNSWPVTVTDIEELPLDKKLECIDVHHWNDIKQQEIEKIQKMYFQPHVKFYHSSGSEWCKRYNKDIALPISLLYLDNYDYTHNNTSAEALQWIEHYKEYYRTNWHIELNNQQCQLEHFTQLIYLEPYLTKGCIIGLDDTFLYNGCWIGKNGPGVVYLLALGYDIILEIGLTVFLKKS